MADNLHPYQQRVARQQRSAIKPHQPAVLWLTGLSGSGKSTLANALEQRLNQHFLAHTTLIDGDNLRTGLNSDLGFSVEDRQENIRRAGEVAALMYDAGLIVITALISPLRDERAKVRQAVGSPGFVEIYTRCPLEVCEQRDPKGLYRKARQGQIPNFTGISSVYEEPLNPEILVDTASTPLEEGVEIILQYLIDHGVLRR